MKRFLSDPMGWMIAQLAGLAVVAAVVFTVLHFVPEMARTGRLLLTFGTALIVAGGMYAIRRKLMRPED